MREFFAMIDAATEVMETCDLIPRPDIVVPGIENLVIEKKNPTVYCRCGHSSRQHLRVGRCNIIVETNGKALPCQCAGFGYAMPGVDFAVSPSALKQFIKSVPKFVGIYITKTIERDPPSPEMVAGSLLHSVLLEPDKLKEKYLGAPERAKRSDKDKAAWASAEAEAKDTNRTLITREQLTEAVRLADAIMSHRRSRELLEQPGRIEERVDAEDDFTGLKLQRRFDVLLDEGGEVEIKTTKNADHDEFGRQAYTLWYHGAAAFGKLVLDLKGKPGPQSIIAVDKETYEVSVNTVTGQELQIGMRDVRRYLNELRHRINRNDWSSRLEGERALRFPGWAYQRSRLVKEEF